MQVDFGFLAGRHGRTALSTSLSHLSGRKQADAELAQYVKPLGLRQFLLQNLVLEQGIYRWRIHVAAIAREIAHMTGFPDVFHDRDRWFCGASHNFQTLEASIMIVILGS